MHTRTLVTPAYTRYTAPALHHLGVAAAHCLALATPPSDPDLDVEVERRLHTLFVHVLRCETSGVDAADIAAVIAPLRRLVAISPLFARLQAPTDDGTPDHVTVERLCADRSAAPAGTLARLLDDFLLQSPIAMQLRNRIVRREALLLETLLGRGGTTARALVLGAGPALDVRAAADRVRFAADQVTLHDASPRAIAHAVRALGRHAAGVRFVTGDPLRAAADLAAAPPFDLVLVGDAIIDGMHDDVASALLRVVHETLLAPGGRLAFATTSDGDPLRPCLEQLTAWQPVRRSPADVAGLLARAGIPTAPMLTRDVTGVALLVEVARRGAARRAA